MTAATQDTRLRKRVRSVRLHDDAWELAENRGPGAVSILISDGLDAMLDSVRCYRCDALVPVKFADLAGTPLAVWIASAGRAVTAQHPDHVPFTLGVPRASGTDAERALARLDAAEEIAEAHHAAEVASAREAEARQDAKDARQDAKTARLRAASGIRAAVQDAESRAAVAEKDAARARKWAERLEMQLERARADAKEARRTARRRPAADTPSAVPSRSGTGRKAAAKERTPAATVEPSTPASAVFLEPVPHAEPIEREGKS